MHLQNTTSGARASRLSVDSNELLRTFWADDARLVVTPNGRASLAIDTADGTLCFHFDVGSHFDVKLGAITETLRGLR